MVFFVVPLTVLLKVLLILFSICTFSVLPTETPAELVADYLRDKKIYRKQRIGGT